MHKHISTILIYFYITILSLSFISSEGITYALVGGVTDTTAVVTARLNSSSSGTKKISITQLPSNKLLGDYSSQDGNFVMALKDLTASTTYKIRVSYSSSDYIDLNFITFPIQYSSSFNEFSFVASSFVKTESSSVVFESIMSKKPNFFMMIGSIYSSPVDSDDVKDYNEKYDKGN